MRTAAILRWALSASLFVVSCWAGNLALANWWAAGGPPTVHAEQYESRGNGLAFVSVLLFGSAVALGVFSWMRSRR